MFSKLHRKENVIFPCSLQKNYIQFNAFLNRAQWSPAQTGCLQVSYRFILCFHTSLDHEMIHKQVQSYYALIGVLSCCSSGQRSFHTLHYSPLCWLWHQKPTKTVQGETHRSKAPRLLTNTSGLYCLSCSKTEQPVAPWASASLCSNATADSHMHSGTH